MIEAAEIKDDFSTSVGFLAGFGAVNIIIFYGSNVRSLIR